ATRIDARDDFGGVLRILLRVDAEEEAASRQVPMQVAEERRELLAILQLVDARKIVFERREAGALDGVRIHAGGEVVADSLLGRRTSADRLRGIVENAPEIT